MANTAYVDYLPPDLCINDFKAWLTPFNVDYLPADLSIDDVKAEPLDTWLADFLNDDELSMKRSKSTPVLAPELTAAERVSTHGLEYFENILSLYCSLFSYL